MSLEAEEIVQQVVTSLAQVQVHIMQYSVDSILTLSWENERDLFRLLCLRGIMRKLAPDQNENGFILRV